MTALKLVLRPEKETKSDQPDLDGIGRFWKIVEGWSDTDWMQICGRISIDVPVGNDARLFWALGKPEAKRLMTILRECIPMFEVHFVEKEKVGVCRTVML